MSIDCMLWNIEKNTYTFIEANTRTHFILFVYFTYFCRLVLLLVGKTLLKTKNRFGRREKFFEEEKNSNK